MSPLRRLRLHISQISQRPFPGHVVYDTRISTSARVGQLQAAVRHVTQRVGSPQFPCQARDLHASPHDLPSMRLRLFTAEDNDGAHEKGSC